jgi:hypothetical protein
MRSGPTCPGVEEETYADLWDTIDRLRQELKDVRSELKYALSDLNFFPSRDPQICVENHKRKQGKKLTPDERRAVLHMHEFAMKEMNSGKFVSSADPMQRVASYLGMSLKTVLDAVLGRNTVDRRGKHPRIIQSRLFSSDLQQYTGELNAVGKCVNLTILRNRLKEAYGDDFRIPSKESIRVAMVSMKFSYKSVNRTKNFVESEDIKKKRRLYLQEKYSLENKDAVFVYLDESYCNLNHVSSKVSCFVSL